MFGARSPRRMRGAPGFAPAPIFALILAAVLAAACARAPAPRPAGGAAEAAGPPRYYPGPGDDWKRLTPDEAAMDAALLAEAVAYARENETRWPTNLRQTLEESLAGGPHGEIIGPVKDRGGPNGLIVRGGYIIAEWGETDRVDMTFSVTKSFLATTAGLALDLGRIRSVHDAVRQYVDDGGFEPPRNHEITWHMLLNQTSEWEGTLWGKPDSADRREGRDRVLRKPGTFWEYNDVRVNRTALALLQVWRRPLPRVLRGEVMDPIGASDRWEWHGYQNSFVTIDGEPMQSVSGGGHWGGGLWMSARDMARFGYLYLRGGRWRDRQVLSREWVRMATTPTRIKPTYGYMWWLNTDRALYPSAPESSFFARGAGANIIWVDPEHDLVAVVRWIDPDAVDGFIERVLASIRKPAPAE